jgi:hypothetical protein
MGYGDFWDEIGERIGPPPDLSPAYLTGIQWRGQLRRIKPRMKR